MRQFLYYNQDSVNSLIAQIEQGLLIKGAADETKEQTTSSTQETQSNITGDLSAKVLGIGASIQGDLQGTDSDTEIATQLVRSVQEKALHDYAFDKIFEHMTRNNLINSINPKIGSIILADELPTFLDMNYFIKLFDSGGAIEFGNDMQEKQRKKQEEEEKQKLKKGEQMPVIQKVKFDNLKNKIANDEQERIKILDEVKAYKKLIPYNRFMIADHYLIPLADKYLRDDPDVIAFKYGGQMSVFGHITNIIDAEEQRVHTNSFAPMYDSVNKVVFTLFQNKKRIFIVHPVAIYY